MAPGPGPPAGRRRAHRPNCPAPALHTIGQRPHSAPPLPLPALTRFLPRRSAPAAALALAAALPVLPGGALAQNAPSLFGMGEVQADRFILVAAPIGSGSRSQLNIYEQINQRRPCFSVAPGLPAVVNPLLASFDFSGICSRYIDTNGYSLRIGDRDLATVYRLSVVPTASDIQLLALPTAGSGPELLVARSQGLASGFLKLHFEPGWRLARRQFRGRSLGHVYLYRDSWPAAAEPGGAASSSAPSLAPAPSSAAASQPASSSVKPLAPAPAGAPPPLPSPR